MEKNRNFVLIAILSILVASGYFLFEKQGKDKIACSEHLDSAHELVNETHPSIANLAFDEYFYSSNLDTCIAGIVKKEDVFRENKAQTSYLILDTLNNREIWFALGTQYYQPQSEHEIEMTQTDIGYQSEYYSKLSNLR